MGLVGAAPTLAAEAVRAVDRLAAGRAERDLGVLAAGRARGGEHLAGAAVATVAAATTTAAAVATAAAGAVAPAAAVATAAATGRIAAAGAVATVAAIATAATARIAGSLAAGATRRTATRLGEPALCVEVLLTRGEHELLAAIGAGQILVVVHETKTPLGSRAIPPGFLASAVRGVRVVVELRMNLP